MLSRDEQKQYEMERTWPVSQHNALRYFIGDVRDQERLVMAFRDVDYVIHAAALKHVAIAESNPFECINTNVVGAENVVRAAIQCGVKGVIALSTDKAANPVNLYGASKLAADKIFVAANHLSGDIGTRFSVVRYGNVVGSRGSVLPLFRQLVADGAQSLPITDPRMTRFWITVEQGVSFVLSCLANMRGGEIFVPKIPSMKIVDLAQCIAPNLDWHCVGIRPGEKLHESMIPADDSRQTFDIGDRYVITPPFEWWDHSHLLAHGANRVTEDFSYTSENNPEWLTEDRLHALLAQTRIE